MTLETYANHMQEEMENFKSLMLTRQLSQEENQRFFELKKILHVFVGYNEKENRFTNQ